MPSNALYNSPIGPILLTEEAGALTSATLGAQLPAGAAPAGTPILRQAIAELAEYFAGSRKTFTVPLAPQGTAFQQQVWRQLCAIPYGETRSYGALATSLGKQGGARAVGMGCNRNPLLLFVPCHRVVGANGSLTGYAAGLSAKQYLLTLEGSLKT